MKNKRPIVKGMVKNNGLSILLENSNSKRILNMKLKTAGA
jgi:hypothetical protein